MAAVLWSDGVYRSGRPSRFQREISEYFEIKRQNELETLETINLVLRAEVEERRAAKPKSEPKANAAGA